MIDSVPVILNYDQLMVLRLENGTSSMKKLCEELPVRCGLSTDQVTGSDLERMVKLSIKATSQTLLLIAKSMLALRRVRGGRGSSSSSSSNSSGLWETVL